MIKSLFANISMIIEKWNKGRAVGERIGFSISEIQQIYKSLQNNPFELCLFCLAIDTMLRGSDILKLKVKDIQDTTGKIRTYLVFKQQKTKYPVYPVITQHTADACAWWIATSKKQANDYLFTIRNNKPITTGWYRCLVKRWASDIGLNNQDYSSHSLRRSKALYLYHTKGVDIHHISQLLGHSSTMATNRYLRTDISEAQRIALEADMLNEPLPPDDNDNKPPSHKQQSLTDDQIDALMIEFAEFLKSKYSKKKG